MDTFNLVPDVYRRRCNFWFDLKITGLLAGLIVLSAAIGSMLLNRNIENHKTRLFEITQSRKAIDIARAEVDSINARKQKLEDRYTLLKALRGNISVRDLFAAMDASLSAEIEFDALNFERAGEPIESEKHSAESSYFIIIPKYDGRLKDRYDAWRIDANLTIRGRAKSHSAMADFMTQLSKQDTIEHVKLLRTGGSSADKGISFELYIVVKNYFAHSS